MGATGTGVENLHAQTNTVEESDKLLEDILRQRTPPRIKTKKKKSSKSRRVRKARPARGRNRFAGRWLMNAKCSTGKFVITLNLTTANASTVAGTTSSSSGFSTRILGGKVSGSSIRFRRRTSNFIVKVTDTVNGRLTSGSRMSGTITGGVGRCTFTASR
ncbi:MAG: hypothetical protein ACTSY1_00120 [Alphaproteobacteria bacterium]